MQVGFYTKPKQINKLLQQTKYIAKSFLVWFITKDSAIDSLHLAKKENLLSKKFLYMRY